MSVWPPLVETEVLVKMDVVDDDAPSYKRSAESLILVEHLRQKTVVRWIPNVLYLSPTYSKCRMLAAAACKGAKTSVFFSSFLPQRTRNCRVKARHLGKAVHMLDLSADGECLYAVSGAWRELYRYRILNRACSKKKKKKKKRSTSVIEEPKFRRRFT